VSNPSVAPYRSLLIAAGLLAVLGWAGLVLLVNASLPTIGPRWLFFTLLTTAATGTALPFIWLLHRRFDRDPVPAGVGVLLRQGVLFGLYVSLCAWLQINRSLSLGLALVIAVGLVAIEALIRLTERARWRPGR
jgi:hypothetical protein